VGLDGGAIYTEECINVTIADCVMSNNSALKYGTGYGGAICLNLTANHACVTNCIIEQNKSWSHGGAIACLYNSSVSIKNCLIVANRCIEGVGAIFAYGESGQLLTLANCTVTDNVSLGQHFLNAVYLGSFANTTVTNCIVQHNFPDQIQFKRCDVVVVTNNNIGGGWPGVGNIDADPMFVAPGYWVHKNDPNVIVEPNNPKAIWVVGDYHLLPVSPCINAGDPNYAPAPGETDLDDRPRISFGRIDMGAYEFFNDTPIANAGPDQTIPAGLDCTADVTLDGSASSDPDGDPLTYIWKLNGQIIASSGDDNIVNFVDFAALAEQWSDSEESFQNLSILANAWLATPDSLNWDPNCNVESGLSTGPVTTVNLPLGEHHIQLVVNDGIDNSEPDEVVITVLDNTPPEFTLSVTPAVLWPPDHQMIKITPTWTVADNCDQSPQVTLVGITSNELDDDKGDGNTTGDIEVRDDGSIYLCAERSGTGSGRIYTITYQAANASGNTAVRSATVTVPHDQAGSR
jgi:hypothetical protein